MLLARRLAFLLACGSASAAATPAFAWNPFKAAGNAVGNAIESTGHRAGKGLGEGAVEALQPALVSTIDTVSRTANTLVADLDVRLTRQVDHAGGVASRVLSETKGVVDDSLDKVDHVLEKRLLQVQSTGENLIEKLDGAVDRNLHTADRILKERSAQLARHVSDSINQADQALEARINQVDEAVALRLGNVDVIASKQRLGLEETLVRTGVLLGLLVFVVFVLRTMWKEVGKVQENLGEKAGLGRAVGYATGLARPALLQIAAATLAVLVIYALYDRLPLGARKQAAELAAMHRREMNASLARFDFSRTRFHASQLEILLPEQGAYYQAMASKASLLRDLVMRPALLATPQGAGQIAQRLQTLEHQLGERADPDVLTMKALVLWQVGDSKRDEHAAASYCARALRLSPGGFALAPLARHYIRAFLHAPYLAPDTPFGRDSESLPDLRVLAAAPIPRNPDFPLAPMLGLNRLIAKLEREVTPAYLDMLDAHARVLQARGSVPGRTGRRRPQPAPEPSALGEARIRRTEAATRVLAAWRRFDDALDRVPGLASQSTVLAIFRLDDATYTRAAWFVERPQTDDLAPLLTEISDSKLKTRLAPPRIAWEREYGDLIARDLLSVAELQEADRFAAFEKQNRDFESAYVAQRLAGPKQEAERRTAALRAARLGLYVNGPVHRARVPVATMLVPEMEALEASARQTLAEAMQTRGMRTL